MKRQGFEGELKLSPLEILGAGRVDPFLSYPVEKPESSLHELMDFGKLTGSYLLLVISLNTVF
jgi:hypothetical protein